MAVAWLVLLAVVLLVLALGRWAGIWLHLGLAVVAAVGLEVVVGGWAALLFTAVYVVQFALALESSLVQYGLRGVTVAGPGLGVALRAAGIVAGLLLLGAWPWLGFVVVAALIGLAAWGWIGPAGGSWWRSAARANLPRSAAVAVIAGGTGLATSVLSTLALTTGTTATTAPITTGAALGPGAVLVVAAAALALLAAFLQPPDGHHLGFAIPSVTEPVLLTLAAVRALLVALHASGATWAPVPPDWLTALTAFLVLAIYIALGHRRLRRGRDQGASSPVEEEYEEEPVTDRSRVSVRFPRRLVKGHSATFLVQIYPPFRSRTAQRHAAALFGDVETTGADGRGIIQSGAAEVALSCPAMRFAAPVRLLLKREGADLAFWGQPADTAQPGPHAGLLTIRDPVTGDQQFSLPFTVIVVDYAFGRVSRLAVNRVAAGALGALSVAGFAFGLVTQTNQVVGLVAGGVSAALSAFMTARMTSVYRRPGVTAGDQTDAP